MSKDQKDSGKEFTFIKEQILPRKRSRFKKVCVSLSATLILAVIFGVVARIAFIVSEPVISRLLGIDMNRKQITFASVPENNNQGAQSTPAAGKEEKKEEEQKPAPSPEVKPLDGQAQASGGQSKKDEENTEKKPEAKPENKTVVVEQKIDATVEDYTSMFSGLKKIAVKALTSTVTVTCIKESVDVLENPLETYTDTPGLVVANNGVEFMILVSADEINDAKSLEASFIGNTRVEAKLMAKDEDTGLAILSVPLNTLSDYVISGTEPMELGESYLLTYGTPVLAIGSPNGMSNSFDYGMITNAAGVVYLTDLRLDLFYTNIITAPNGLGYIINLNGTVVGIISNHFNENADNVCTAIGISRVKKLIEKMVNGKERAYVGIVAEDMAAEALLDAQINYGIYVSEVVPKSPAYVAGIQTGDIIVSFNNNPVGGVNSFVSILDGMAYKSEVTVGVVRFNNGTPKNIELNLTVGRVK